MIIQRMMLFASAAALVFASAFAIAEGQADRRNETGVAQQADPIKDIHERYGATAAGPTSSEGMMKDRQALEDSWGIDFPEHVETAHERKRYIFDSEDF